jgi:hypothetical membrane protein
MIDFLKTGFWLFGLLGCAVITAAIAGTALLYRGASGQRYSFFNHYISELGEVGVSRAAWLFNSGMIVTGLLFIPFTTGFSLKLGSSWGYLGGLAGLWAGASCLLVGVYPMNNLNPHARVATSYFRAGLATVLFFSIAIFFQERGQEIINTWVNLAGIVAIASYTSFIVITARQDSHLKQEGDGQEPVVMVRPRFWVIPMLEWLVFLSTILWFLVVPIFMWLGG